MKRLIILALLALLVFPVVAFADATTATKARVAQVGISGVESVIAIADGVSGDTVDVETWGALRTGDFAELSSGVQMGDYAVLTGSGVIKSITANTSSAESFLAIYDAASATGTPVVDVQLDVAAEQYTVPINLDVDTGIYVDYSGAFGTVAYSVLYNAD